MSVIHRKVLKNASDISVTSTKGDCVMPHQTPNTDAIIKHMPDYRSDEYDVNAMIDIRLCVNVPVKRIVRLNTHN